MSMGGAIVSIFKGKEITSDIQKDCIVTLKEFLLDKINLAELEDRTFEMIGTLLQQRKFMHSYPTPGQRVSDTYWLSKYEYWKMNRAEKKKNVFEEKIDAELQMGENKMDIKDDRHLLRGGEDVRT